MLTGVDLGLLEEAPVVRNNVSEVTVLVDDAGQVAGPGLVPDTAVDEDRVCKVADAVPQRRVSRHRPHHRRREQVRAAVLLGGRAERVDAIDQLVDRSDRQAVRIDEHAALAGEEFVAEDVET